MIAKTFFASMTYVLGALGGRSHFVRFQRVTKICQTIKCISNPIVSFKRCRYDVTHKGPSAPANRSKAPGLHQVSDRRCLLQTFLWPSEILSSIENTLPVPASDGRASCRTFQQARRRRWLGPIYHFCSQDCRDKFETSPKSYTSGAARPPPNMEHTHEHQH
jgi:hypothetical protein